MWEQQSYPTGWASNGEGTHPLPCVCLQRRGNWQLSVSVWSAAALLKLTREGLILLITANFSPSKWQPWYSPAIYGLPARNGPNLFSVGRWYPKLNGTILPKSWACFNWADDLIKLNEFAVLPAVSNFQRHTLINTLPRRCCVLNDNALHISLRSHNHKW